MFEKIVLDFKDGYYIWGTLSVLALIFSIWAASHALIFKRDSRSAAGWVAVIIFSPFVGALLYYLFGINRIQRKAQRLSSDTNMDPNSLRNVSDPKEFMAFLDRFDQERLFHRQPVMEIGERLGLPPLHPGLTIEPLVTGDQAYPEMLAAIRKAEKSITLLSFIFRKDPVGLEFVDELIEANKRGVQIRVLVDGVGTGSSFLSILGTLRKAGIPCSAFLPISPFFKSHLANMRNHRKLLVVDGQVAFTGGLNIAQLYWPKRQYPKEPVLDLHFKVKGPIVSDLQRMFCDNWAFTTREILAGEPWFSVMHLVSGGKAMARVIPDGPGENFEVIRWHFLGAINNAQKNIRILSPYFLPDSGIITALAAAALRGVQVDVLVPEFPDHKYFKWAVQGNCFELLSRGVNIWYTPKPFDHSKLMVVDDDLVSIGSSNWDARSLRLNFELNLEVYCSELAQSMIELFESKKQKSKPYSLKQLQARSYPVKLRDGFMRLFTPYL